MDPLIGDMLKESFKLIPGIGLAVALAIWILRNMREREVQVLAATTARETAVLAATTKREADIIAQAERREERLLKNLEKLADQYERVAVVLGQQGVALKDGTETLEKVVRELAEMRREHAGIIKDRQP